MTPHLWLIRVISKIVPDRFRSDWIQEWEAELQFGERRGRRDMLRRSASSFWDALALQPRRLEDEMFQDLKQSIRLLMTNKLFTAIAVLSLALGIGANTAIYSVVHALVFKPLPYANPDELVAVVFDTDKEAGNRHWPYPKFESLREQQSSFEAITAYSQESFPVIVENEPDRVGVELVDAGYFALLGVQAKLGRVFLREDQTAAADGVTVLSYDFWRRHFNSNPDVLGKTVRIKEYTFAVIGVMPEGFRGQAGTADLWTPLTTAEKLMDDGALKSRTWWWLKIIGRLKREVTLTQARNDLLQISPRVAPDIRIDKSPERITAIPLKDTKVDPAVKRSFLILLVVVGFVLLIACANTAHLLLSRAVARQKEFAIRAALGGGRFRIARQVLTESIFLAFVGGSIGLFVAAFGVNWLTTAKPWNKVGFWTQYAETFDYFKVDLDWAVLAFNFLLVLATGVLFGLVPAYKASRAHLSETLKTESGGSATGFRSLRRPGFRSLLVVAEIALAVVLLAGAGLMIKSFSRLSSVDLGFQTERLLTLQVGSDRRPVDFYPTMIERMETIPGVQSAGMAYGAPLSGFTMRARVTRENLDSPQAEGIRAIYNVVTRDYFKTVGIDLLKGRTFTDQDRIGMPRVAVVNRMMAELAWPGGEAIGKRVSVIFRSLWTKDPWIEIVGVVDNVKYGLVEDPFAPVLYFPTSQPFGMPSGITLAPEWLMIRTTVEPASIIASVRNQVQSVDRTIPLYDIRTMNDRTAHVTSTYRYSMVLITLFAALALLLSMIGVYGVMAHSVQQRTRELGIRVALGAQPRQLFRMVFADGALLIVIGLISGLGIAAMTTRLLTSQLYDVRPSDPLTFIYISLFLAAVGFTACYIPVRRAARLDAMDALRQ